MIPPLTVMPERGQAPLGGAPFHLWAFPDGRAWAEFHRLSDSVTVRFPGFADFAVPADGGPVLCHPVPGHDAGTRDHLFMNQVVPLVRSRQGRLSYHASAVAIDGGAIAFLGATGRGKSTLAAAFAAAGIPFLTDDGLSVVECDGRWLVEPSHPSVRLREDSREALIDPGLAPAGAVSCTRKARFAAGEGLPFCDTPQPLVAAYFLGAGPGDGIRFAPISGAGLLAEWVRHSFLLDLDETAAVAAHFAAQASFCAAIPGYRLDFPRCYGALGEVRRAIVEHAARHRAG